MKILVLAGSPHKKGTSNTLVEEFTKEIFKMGLFGEKKEGYKDKIGIL